MSVAQSQAILPVKNHGQKEIFSTRNEPAILLGKPKNLSKPGSHEKNSGNDIKNSVLHRASEIEKIQELKDNKNLSKILQIVDEKEKKSNAVIRKMKLPPKNL